MKKSKITPQLFSGEARRAKKQLKQVRGDFPAKVC